MTVSDSCKTNSSSGALFWNHNHIIKVPDCQYDTLFKRLEVIQTSILHFMKLRDSFWINEKPWIVKENFERAPSEWVWFLVKSFQLWNSKLPSGYRLSKGDTIKLGRVRFKITELKVEGKLMG